MLTQGIREDAAKAMNNPSPDMFATAMQVWPNGLFPAPPPWQARPQPTPAGRRREGPA